MNNGLLNLIDVKQGTQVIITSFEGGTCYITKLNRYGLFPGDRARVLRHAPFGGPILIEIRGMEIALGRGIASRILVEMDPCDSR